MSIVVDASVLVAALLDNGRGGEWAESVIASGALHGPGIVRAETANILRRLERARQITAAEAAAAYEDLMRLDIETFPFDPFADRVWELRHNLTSYDAWYVAVAEAFGLPLATLDERLARADGPTCAFLAPAGSRIRDDS